MSVQAQAMDHSKMSGMNMPSMKMDGMPASMTEGEVRKIDKETKKITLKHGEIKNLDMPPMTMVFRVQDAGMLDAVKVGDKVKFDADKVGGQYTVLKLAPAK